MPECETPGRGIGHPRSVRNNSSGLAPRFARLCYPAPLITFDWAIESAQVMITENMQGEFHIAKPVFQRLEPTPIRPGWGKVVRFEAENPDLVTDCSVGGKQSITMARLYPF